MPLMIPGDSRQFFNKITDPATKTALITRVTAPPASMKDHDHKRFRYVNNYDKLQSYSIVDGTHTGTVVSLMGVVKVGPERLITVEDANVNFFVGPPRDLKRVWAGGARKTRRGRKGRRATKRRSS